MGCLRPSRLEGQAVLFTLMEEGYRAMSKASVKAMAKLLGTPSSEALLKFLTTIWHIGVGELCLILCEVLQVWLVILAVVMDVVSYCYFSHGDCYRWS